MALGCTHDPARLLSIHRGESLRGGLPAPEALPTGEATGHESVYKSLPCPSQAGDVRPPLALNKGIAVPIAQTNIWEFSQSAEPGQSG